MQHNSQSMHADNLVFRLVVESLFALDWSGLLLDVFSGLFGLSLTIFATIIAFSGRRFINLIGVASVLWAIAG